MKWTTQAPVHPGWWWWRHRGVGLKARPREVWLTVDGELRCNRLFGLESDLVGDMPGEWWQEPIPVPAEAGEEG